jgi:3-hydroxyisobutyrate dehydrogenase-like beta-hydroxyacid dehydrogenase
VFESKGARVLDAPLSGGRDELLIGKQEVMVGGDPAVLEQVRPILNTFGDQIFHAGAIGAGTIVKLAHNMAMRGLLQIVAESMTMGVKAGVDAETVWEGIRCAASTSRPATPSRWPTRTSCWRPRSAARSTCRCRLPTWWSSHSSKP